MIKEYACPRCGRLLMVLDVNQQGFKYKLVCRYCSYYDYAEELNNLKEYKNGEKDKEIGSGSKGIDID